MTKREFKVTEKFGLYFLFEVMLTNRSEPCINGIEISRLCGITTSAVMLYNFPVVLRQQ
jgi:hypothetical protein